MIFIVSLATIYLVTDYTMKKKYRYIYRDAKTWRLVSEAYALANPSTTVRERIEY